MEEQYARDPSRGPVCVVDCQGNARWRKEWDHHPQILPSNRWTPKVPTLTLGKGCLPYHPWDGIWRARDHRGTLYLTRDEIKRGLHLRQQHGRFVLLEPPAKDRKNANRVWPGWAELAVILKRTLPVPVLQLDRPEATKLPGVIGIPHRDFRMACAILKAADLCVLTEGGITTGAAHVGAPAVVLWGGCASVEGFGYPEHVNLVDDDQRTPCRSARTCDHCTAAWAKLTPEHVADVVLQTWRDRKVAA